ncbi:MAG: hypothetical protein IJX74_01615 [Clostridia bacterium]|nr:hypothetical protein [Clostridia bacterium]
MLEVLPIQTKDEQREFCERCGVEFIPDLMAYHAKWGGELIGVCQFTMNSDGGFIRSMGLVRDKFTSREEFEALFVLGRATLNFIDLCGVHTAYYTAEDFTDEKIIHAIGFKKNSDGVYEMSLTDFFKEPCSHH